MKLIKDHYYLIAYNNMLFPAICVKLDKFVVVDDFGQCWFNIGTKYVDILEELSEDDACINFNDNRYKLKYPEYLI